MYYLFMTTKSLFNLPKHLKKSYRINDKVESSGVYVCSVCDSHRAFRRNENFSQCQNCVDNRRSETNEWLSTNEIRHFISKNINNEYDRIMSFQFIVAEKITAFAGNVWFATIHIIWFTSWILVNIGVFGEQRIFDSFPFGLLTMIVSLEAIFLSTFIMISQNMAGKKTELRNDHEYQVNLNTEKQVAEVHAMIKELLNRKDE